MGNEARSRGLRELRERGSHLNDGVSWPSGLKPSHLAYLAVPAIIPESRQPETARKVHPRAFCAGHHRLYSSTPAPALERAPQQRWRPSSSPSCLRSERQPGKQQQGSAAAGGAGGARAAAAATTSPGRGTQRRAAARARGCGGQRPAPSAAPAHAGLRAHCAALLDNELWRPDAPQVCVPPTPCFQLPRCTAPPATPSSLPAVPGVHARLAAPWRLAPCLRPECFPVSAATAARRAHGFAGRPPARSCRRRPHQ